MVVASSCEPELCSLLPSALVSMHSRMRAFSDLELCDETGKGQAMNEEPWGECQWCIILPSPYYDRLRQLYSTGNRGSLTVTLVTLVYICPLIGCIVDVRRRYGAGRLPVQGA